MVFIKKNEKSGRVFFTMPVFNKSRRKMIKSLFAFLLFALLVSSCQNESFNENTEALNRESQLTNVLKSMSANDTDSDNVIDSTGCFKVKLPVTVVVNGSHMGIVDASQYEDVAAIFDQSEEDQDAVSFVFPITVQNRDYEETVVNSQDEFDAMINSCDATFKSIGDDCVSLVFPVTVYTYNSGFQMQSTYVVNNNKELHVTLMNLGSNEYYSVGYPVSLSVNDGAGITVNNNNEMLGAINNALQGCEQGGCTNPQVLTEELSLYITFSNGVVRDLKGSEVIVPSNTVFTTDREGNQNCAVVFDGTNFIQVLKNSQNAIVQGEAYSVSLWFRMQNTNGGDIERLFSKGNSGEVGFSLSIKDLNAPVFQVTNTLELFDTAWKTDAALPIDTNNWHHLVITVDADNNYKLYRDGELRNSQNAMADISSGAMDYFIGNNFKGFLDDLRVYKKTLSPGEVQTLFELEGDCNTCLE